MLRWRVSEVEVSESAKDKWMSAFLQGIQSGARCIIMKEIYKKRTEYTLLLKRKLTQYFSDGSIQDTHHGLEQQFLIKWPLTL